MSSERPAEQQHGGKGCGCGCHHHEPEVPGGGGPDEECRPDLIDDLKCQAKGVEAQYNYNQTTQAAVEAARTSYDDARRAYRTARDELEPRVQDLLHDVTCLVDRIRCQIMQKRIVCFLDDAFAEYVAELARCPDESGGCCVDDVDCSFTCDESGMSDATPRQQVEHYAETISRHEKHVAAARECFETLVGEAAALRARIEKAQGTISDVKGALSADAASTDLKLLYARAVVVRRDLGSDVVWNGFGSTHEFVDCLCRALTCWTKGWEAIGDLTGRKAVAQCKADGEAAHCATLRENAGTEILAIYDRLSARTRCTMCEGEHPPATPCSGAESAPAE